MKNKIIKEEELNESLQQQVSSPKYKLKVKKFIIVTASLALLATGGVIGYNEYQTYQHNQNEIAYEEFVNSTKIENIDITEVTENQEWKIITLLGRGKSSFSDGTVQYGEWYEQGHWLILNDNAFKKDDMLSFETDETSNIYNNVMSSLVNGDVEVSSVYEKFFGKFDYSKYDKLFIVGKDAMNIDGDFYYISTYQTRTKDDPNSEWTEDGNLYISYGALGGSDVARFMTVGQIDINNILNQNHSIKK